MFDDIMTQDRIACLFVLLSPRVKLPGLIGDILDNLEIGVWRPVCLRMVKGKTRLVYVRLRGEFKNDLSGSRSYQGQNLVQGDGIIHEFDIRVRCRLKSYI